ncbi:MAG: glycosyltransferase [Kiritimatiellia bacterium]|jgi:glycosyltransferase involved in cell wall biosynthesis
MKISVITTVYNRPEHLRLFLAALEIQTRRPDEVVVSDDGSDPDNAAAVERHLAACGILSKRIWEPHNGYRLSAGRNRAIRVATGDYLVFADCDIALLPDALAVHERCAAPRRLLAGHRGILSEETTRELMQKDPAPTAEDWDRAWKQADFTESNEASVQHKKQSRLRRWHLAKGHKPKLLGCHFSLFRDDVWRVNGFDERYVGWGYEDDDFARRLYSAGTRPFSVIDDARALHLWHPSLAPQALKRRRDRPNRRYFRRLFVPARCEAGLERLV